MIQQLKVIAISAMVIFSVQEGFAQQELTLKQCVELGLSNNLQIKKAGLEIDKSRQKEWEVISAAFPQITPVYTLNDNLILGTSLLPGEIFGKAGYIPVRMGTQYNTSAGVNTSVTLDYSTLFLAHKASLATREMAEMNKEKVEQNVVFSVANAYYSIQLVNEQIKMTDANLKKTNELVAASKVQYENGIIKKMDYQRLLVNQTNLSTELQNNVNAYEYSLLSLKFQMGVPLDSAIAIALNMETMTIAENNSGFASNIDLQIIDQQKTLNDLNIKQTWAGYYPKITASASYMTQAFQNDNIAFKNWYGNSVVGGTVSWPLFDGLTKKFRVDQIKIQQTQLDIDKKYLSENLKLNIANANNKLKLSQMDLQAQDQNRKLAEEIYAAAEVQYKEGISTISDLLAVEYSMKESQTKYLQALVKVKQAELELLNNNGNILSIAK